VRPVLPAFAVRTPHVNREPVLTFPARIEPRDGDRLPAGEIVRPGHHVIPPQRAGLLGADADLQAQYYVRVQARTLGRDQQGFRLIQREALGRPPAAAVAASSPAPRHYTRRGRCPPRAGSPAPASSGYLGSPATFLWIT